MLTDDGPPHMIKASNNGIDVDIAREVLQEIGYRVKLDYAPLKRSMYQVAQKKANLFLPTFFQDDTSELFISASIIKYRPMVFSLKKSNFLFKNISDLKGERIATFQGATGYFGEEFMKISKYKNYRELHDMSKFPEMLIKGRTDVVVLDYYIFYYFLQKYLKDSPTDKFLINEIAEFSLFPEVKAYVGFHDQKLRNDFNNQLHIYKSQNKDNKVIEKYIGQIESQL
jgi:ABC-type amino acid transport substrate-binding protein